jgi:hypothetical protein
VSPVTRAGLTTLPGVITPEPVLVPVAEVVKVPLPLRTRSNTSAPDTDTGI